MLPEKNKMLLHNKNCLSRVDTLSGQLRISGGICLKVSFKDTSIACYIGYVTQAIVNNFAPLLFLTFQSSYNIGLSRITLLVTINFATQLTVDFLSAKYADKIGYRRAIVAAHVLSAIGLCGLGIFPEVFPSAYAGLVTAVIIYAVGGGLIEVLISPIMEACPTENKSASMSFLHSFYCWGSVAVVLASTVFFSVAGVGNWRIMAIIWAIIPILNAVYFSRVPIAHVVENGEGMEIKELFREKVFWVLALLMVCAGASELAMSQWASTFAESALNISKTAGDLMGPCFFAVLMGCARLLHSRLAGRIETKKYMGLCAVGCILGYVMAAFSPAAVVGLLGCGVCGFSVGAMWPGTFSVASASCPRGGTAMFALLALAGDLGCTLGPSVVGYISDAADGSLKVGLMVAAVFPVLLIAGLVMLKRLSEQQKTSK